ncbi:MULTISPECIES: hydrogen peroxide-inducible genes activator [unclassified Iodidimonas]|uniref:hydrogen peroxide-inducible genes activator n=1 Tax=unclassified Iodidimonas TaxID=2626145 RepID=UPI002483082C|nr:MULTISPECIES: hydrogen peroxide-inducible genes activator [unclassified Iodidimonas]
MTITKKQPHREPGVKQIRYFLEVAKAGSFRRAASRLGVSQPTLSAQISVLEEILGCPLLERAKTGAMPTPIGQEIIPLAEEILHDISLLMDRARLGHGGLGGTHRLGVSPSIGPYLLPEVIGAIHDAYPDLRLYVREEDPRELEAKLLDGRFDIILTSMPMDIGGLVTHNLYDEPLLLTASLDHPLAAKAMVEGADLRDQTLLALEERYRFFDQVQELAHRYQARLLREYEGTSLDTLRHMVGMNMGLGFLPALYVRSEILPRKDVVVLGLNEELAYRTVAMAWRPSVPHRRLYRELAQFIRRMCQERLSADVRVHDPSAFEARQD